MPRINENFLKLQAGYLFPEIARRVRVYQEQNPGIELIKLGIGDVTRPLVPAVAEAMKLAVDKMTTPSGFHGYGPEQGYPFLREAIVENDYKPRGCNISADEIFVSDGSKCDSANILDILGPSNSIAVADPVYPVYVDTNVMAGNTDVADEDGRYGRLIYLEATEANGFTPDLPDRPVDVLYLCYPNNPTGAVATRELLEKWVAYANQHRSLILFDAAYEAFISDDAIPRSIYEVEGARTCAIEFRSFSKTAGFSGVRCAFTVVPKELQGRTAAGDDISLHRLWSRRQGTKFNGVGYVVQKGAAAIYSEEGRHQVAASVNSYMQNAAILEEGLSGLHLKVFGGKHAPYVWVRCPDGIGSWEMFDRLLTKAGVVCTPGVGFGKSGEGYVRLSAFNSRDNVVAAMDRLRPILQ
jgi:LL-diaminopimelate aminotransferase